jgi:hypothetical protein
MTGNASEVLVGRQHCEIVAHAQLCQEGVDGSDLHAIPAAAIAQVRRPDVIIAIRRQQWDGRKSVKNLSAALWARKALQQLLKHQAGSQDRLAVFDCADQHTDFADRSRSASPKRERPNTRVHKQGQSRARSAL